ncbi:MAG: ParA family protein [Micrococcales bacterium]
MHVLSVSSLKGGVGKTTVALGLASAAYARSLRTLVVDLDSQCDASTGLGVTESLGTTVLDVLKNPRHTVVHNAIVASTWARNRLGNIDVMVGDPRIQALDDSAPDLKDIWKLEEALSLVENEYDLVIIDTHPSLNGLTRTAWAASDRVLVVTEPGIFSVGSVGRTVQAVDELSSQVNHRLGVVGIVVNRVQPNFDEHQYRLQELSEQFPDLLMTTALNDHAAVQQAQGAARAIHSWPGTAAAELSDKFDELLSNIQDDAKNRPARRSRDRHNKFSSGKAKRASWFRRTKEDRD